MKKNLAQQLYFGCFYCWLLIFQSCCCSPEFGCRIEDEKAMRLTNSIGMTFVDIPAGKFMMGSPDNEKGRETNEGPQHLIVIKKSFQMATTEVTQEQWFAVMGTRPWLKKKGLCKLENPALTAR